MLLNPARFGSSYVTNAVVFNGGTYLTRGADYTSIANSSQGIFSCWVKFNGGNGSSHTLVQGTGDNYRISRLFSNKFHFLLSDGSNLLEFATVLTYTTSAGWTHVLASWDTAYSVGNKLSHLYIDDVSDKDTPSDNSPTFTIDYTLADHAVGASVTTANYLEADIADLYFAPGQFLDFSNSTNRRKFISSTGKPVSLGSDGSTPTGTAPRLFLSGQATTFATNLGSGGGMTTNGSLVDAGTSPSD